jgi:hypothetical protein
MSIKQSKNHLLEIFIFRLTIHGAFQRNNIYSRKLTKKEDNQFKSFIRHQLSKGLSRALSKTKYSDTDHFKSIKNLSGNVTEKFHSILKDEKLNIGTSQKLINLFWKANWIFKHGVSKPIHCPFDGVIINKLPKEARHIRWTKMDDIDTYKELVKVARRMSKGVNLAEWELVTYNQSNFIT